MLTARYEEFRTKALSIPEDAVYPHAEDDALPDFVLASNGWWKQWFVDDTSALSLLEDFSGQLAFHFGEIDRQFSAQLEVTRIANGQNSLSTLPQVTLHPARGHAFATGKPIAGPMDDEAEEILVEQIVSMLKVENDR